MYLIYRVLAEVAKVKALLLKEKCKKTLCK